MTVPATFSCPNTLKFLRNVEFVDTSIEERNIALFDTSIELAVSDEFVKTGLLKLQTPFDVIPLQVIDPLKIEALLTSKVLVIKEGF